ncbi:hypothetical protein QTH97_33305 [Variovorax sp. J22R24]|uniref:hypothetical protein n=1 Tax=Variovorax gracilis TaxID=3053502 RepID=UPI002576D7B8|nr:hypothetical protein [Variovorax sp. J22R24]MDM0109835.1 hypothetical protein [Variovorax sp. J22R24]
MKRVTQHQLRLCIDLPDASHDPRSRRLIYYIHNPFALARTLFKVATLLEHWRECEITVSLAASSSICADQSRGLRMVRH